jgi:hypothetical protein
MILWISKGREALKRCRKTLLKHIQEKHKTSLLLKNLSNIISMQEEGIQVWTYKV